MVQLGSVVDPQGDNIPLLRQLAWVPGERAVSYVYKGDLYRIAAE